MSNRWIASIALLCPAEHREAASKTAASITGNPADVSPEFFSRAVGALGSEEVTHYLAHTRIREKALAMLPALAKQYPGAVWVLTQHEAAPIGKVSVEEWLAGQGLSFIDHPEDEVQETK